MLDLEIFQIAKFCTLVGHNHLCITSLVPIPPGLTPPNDGYCGSLTHLSILCQGGVMRSVLFVLCRSVVLFVCL